MTARVIKWGVGNGAPLRTGAKGGDMAAVGGIGHGWPPEAHNYIELYARFEGALKAKGMLRDKERAEASWLKLADELKEEFFSHIRESGHAATLRRTASSSDEGHDVRARNPSQDRE